MGMRWMTRVVMEVDDKVLMKGNGWCDNGVDSKKENDIG